jgi:hypothetical protein
MSDDLAAVRGAEPTPLPQISESAAHFESRLTRTIVLAASGACFAMFWWVGGVLGIPAHYGFEASLLQQPGSMRSEALVVAAVLVISSAVFGQAVAGRRWGFAGVFAAGLGLCAWSARGGPSKYVYFQASSQDTGRAIYLMLLAELLILFVFMGGIWYWIVSRVDATSAAESGQIADRVSPLTIAQAIGAQVAIVGSCITLFVQSDAKGTVMLALFFVSLAGTGLVQHWYRDEKIGPWFWMGPMLIGAIGYFACFMSGGDSIVVGQPGGPLAALARPLPLDYATSGVLGALMGYWTGTDHPELPVSKLFGRVGDGSPRLRSNADTTPSPTPSANNGQSGQSE